MSSTPIAHHAFLSDRHSCALVDRAGSVEWLSFPRFDSPSVFARLLDDDAGHWQVCPDGEWQASRRYVGRSLVLETTFRQAAGELVLTDALALGPDNEGHRLGADAPHVLVRRLTCVAGRCDVMVDFQPRPQYGLVVPSVERTAGGVSARSGADLLVLTLAGVVDVDHGGARAQLHLEAGDLVHLALQHSAPGETSAHVWSQQDLEDLVARSLAGWESWSELHQAYQGPFQDLVHTSGRVLQGLSYQPSGAIVAAATTSLPEQIGGERNWDYRYAWVRDASFTMEALWVAACPDEAADFFAFMTRAGASGLGPDMSLQIMFGIGGEQDLTERTLDHLRGWRGSRPVRVGNGAWKQRQVDVYGELLGAAARLADQLPPALDDETRRFLVACADTAAVRWRDKDQGIWEVRGDPQHFLYSKVMCWVALDRAITLAPQLGCEDRIAEWQKVRDEIAATVLQRGWDEKAGAFTQFFGSTALDASSLMLPIVGFLPPDDPRMLATIDAIAEHLTDHRGLVYRYRTEEGVDGLAGQEGTFLLCTFWLAQALAMAGQVERAREVFQRAASCVNDLGLLSEEVDPATGELLGNVPQAFSHIGLVNAAWAIDQAERAGRAEQHPAPRAPPTPCGPGSAGNRPESPGPSPRSIAHDKTEVVTGHGVYG